MPSPESIDASAVTSLLGKLSSGSSPGELDRMFASGVTQTGADPGALTQLLKQQSSSSGPSFLDPTYLAISGTLSLFGMGMLIYGKKMGEPRFIFWGVALMVLSYDYTSALVWGLTLALGAAGWFLE